MKYNTLNISLVAGCLLWNRNAEGWHTKKFFKAQDFLKRISFFNNCIYFWLSCVFISPVAVRGGYSSLICKGFSSQWLLLLRNTGSMLAGFRCYSTQTSEVVAYRLSCSEASGIFLDQGSNLCLLHWQADSYPLCQQVISLSFFSIWLHQVLLAAHELYLWHVESSSLTRDQT